jgi:CubicO group peptidase (beta-lactamase class C family)
MPLLSKYLWLLFTSLLITTGLPAQTNFNHLKLKNPSTAGFTSIFFDSLTNQLNDTIQCLGSFLIWRNGGLVYEKYFHGADSTTEFNIKSVTKSVVSALAGIAKQKGLLTNLNTPVVTFFPEFAQPRNKLPTVWFPEEKAYQDSMRSKLTLYQLLTLQHGWDWNDFSGPVNIFINARDPIRFTMDIPFIDTPGTKFIYSSAASSLFGAALERLSIQV